MIDDNATMLSDTHMATDTMRDTNQIKYIQKKKRDPIQLTKNHIESIVAVQDETGNFVLDLRFAPTLVTMMCEEMKEEIKKVLENMPLEQKLVTFEDTLFGLGEFYATGFSFQHPLLERRVMSTTQLFKEPVITLGYEIHDRKYKDDHKMFLH